MALTDTLGTGLTVATNPDPNTLTTTAPYTLSQARSAAPFLPTTAWKTQGNTALFPLGAKDGSGDISIKLHFLPSAGAATTYTINVWMYNPVSDTWAQPKNNGSIAYTGAAIDTISAPGHDALFLEINTLSAGTLSIYFDPSNAQKG
ncbi:MAG: hypothetical protein R2857_14375 [Vampirovibrionales bacterium]|nr:hypothetical protein [Cyanobacteria bacterium HKST-UBA05]MCA9840857.1 hypothetical protein [Cyanobacteria bacterium HKST-UBA03]